MSIQAVIFDMYETLVTQFCSPLYCGTNGVSGGIVSADCPLTFSTYAAIIPP